MSHSLSVRLFTAVMPLNMADAIFRLCLDYYRFYYLFTPSRQILRKRDGRGDQNEKKKSADFGHDVIDFAYACGRFFDEEGDMSWISEDGSLFCSLCGTDIPESLKGLTNWAGSDFTLTKFGESHRLLLWNPKKGAHQWLDSQMPRKPDYGVEGTGLPALCLQEWYSEDKRERYIQYVSISAE